MTRARLAVVALVITVAGITPSVSQAAKFHITHRVSVSGQLTDHWTVDDPQACGPLGDGTVTLTFHTKKTTRAKVVIDRGKNGAGNKLGSWALLAPQGPFHQITDIKSKPATATVTLVDNTSLRPPPTGRLRARGQVGLRHPYAGRRAEQRRRLRPPPGLCRPSGHRRVQPHFGGTHHGLPDRRRRLL